MGGEGRLVVVDSNQGFLKTFWKKEVSLHKRDLAGRSPEVSGFIFLRPPVLPELYRSFQQLF